MSLSRKILRKQVKELFNSRPELKKQWKNSGLSITEFLKKVVK